MSVTVTLAELVDDFGGVQERASEQPVRVVEDGRELAFVVPPSLFHALKQAQREALDVAELSDEEAAMILAAEIPETERYVLDEVG